MKILVIEDEKSTSEAIKDFFHDRYAIDTADTLAIAEKKVCSNEYDLIILDVTLPDGNGVQLCERMRKDRHTVPILMLTAHDHVQDKVDALNSGADDYLTKPFSFSELLARVQALLRRPHGEFIPQYIDVGRVRFDTSEHTVTVDGQPVELRPKELNLLEYLLRNKGKIISRYDILEHVWQSNKNPQTNSIEVHIKTLRLKLEKPFNMKLIRTIHGYGYKILVT